jgi:hypothetical protein
MDTQFENEQNALIDALKYTSDVVSALSIKINIQDEEIAHLKNKLSLIEEQLKINPITEKALDTEKNLDASATMNEDSNVKSRNFEVTSVCESEINRLKKEKVGLIVEKLIQKKNEIDVQMQNPNLTTELTEPSTIKLPEEIILSRRKNRIMRRF